MMWQMDINIAKVDARAEGRAEGIAEGRAEGNAEGQGLMARLVDILLEKGDTESLKRAAKDEEYRMQLMEKYHIQ